MNSPSIMGTADFEQFISVKRTPRTTGGTITVQNHCDAWAAPGMYLGTMNYEILLTEGWGTDGNGSGASSVTITSP